MEQKVSPEPDIVIYPRKESDELLVVACDGIWDVMSNDECCNLMAGFLARGETDMGKTVPVHRPFLRLAPPFTAVHMLQGCLPKSCWRPASPSSRWTT